MIWSDTYPSDDSQANTLHTILQNFKVMLRERFEVNNGTFKEHQGAGEDIAGEHSPSIVGFCGIISDWVSRPTTDLVDGSFWYVESPSENAGLYFIKDSTYKRISASSHTALLYTQYDDELNELDPHTEYIMNNGGSFTASAQFNTLQLALSRGAASYCLPKSHKDLKWSEAHANGSIKPRHLAADIAIGQDRLPITSVSGSDSIIPASGGLVCFPLTRNAPNGTTRVYMSKDEVSAVGTDIKVYTIGGTYA